MILQIGLAHMSEKLMSHITNPVKAKLIGALVERGTATAKELAAANPALAQATLYRYLKKLVDDGVFTVVEERKVRNVTEKTYAMSVDLDSVFNEMLQENAGEAYLALFAQFSEGLMEEFRAYSKRDDIDLQNDGSGFRVSSFHATLDELTTLSKSIHALIRPYTELEPAPGREARSVALIFTPPNKKKEEQTKMKTEE